jgi:hypothetical protein
MTSGSVTRTATALTRCGPPDRNQPRSEIHAPAIWQFDVAIHQRTTILSPMAFYDVFGPGGQAAGQLRWSWHWNSPSVPRARSQSMRRARFGSRSLSPCTQYPQTTITLSERRAKEPPRESGWGSVAFNTVEKWSSDVSEDIAWEVLKRVASQGLALPTSTRSCCGFHVGLGETALAENARI